MELVPLARWRAYVAADRVGRPPYDGKLNRVLEPPGRTSPKMRGQIESIRLSEDGTRCNSASKKAAEARMFDAGARRMIRPQPAGEMRRRYHSLPLREWLNDLEPKLLVARRSRSKRTKNTQCCDCA